MPRRAKPDPLALSVGKRIRQLRQEAGLTAEKLVFESEVGSKGFLSDIEHGLAAPSLRTLGRLANHLRVEVVDLVTFPEENERQRLIDRTRSMAPGVIRRLLRDSSPSAERVPKKGASYAPAAGTVLTVADGRRRRAPEEPVDRPERARVDPLRAGVRKRGSSRG